MKLYSSLIFVLLIALLPSQAIASDTVEKTFCAQTIGYETLDALKTDLLTNVKRLAVNELFGELIAASTAVENFVVTSDQIRTSSVGFVRLEGAINYYNGANLAEVCVTIRAYTTQQDRAKFESVKLTKRHCVSDPDKTTRELTNFVKEEVIIQALLDYDRRLEGKDRNKLLHLMQRVTYLESGFIPDTETYCIRVEGSIVPIEMIALLETGAKASPPTVTPLSSAPNATILPDHKGFGQWDLRIDQYGGADAIPTPADYDGDGKADISVKVHDGRWLIDYASNGFGGWDFRVDQYGGADAVPAPADYDGDGKADISVKVHDGRWLIDYASNGFGGWDFRVDQYGGADATPAPADYDGDGKADISVKVHDGRWLIDYAQ